MGKGFHFDKDDLDFMKDVMEHSDGSERKIGDFVIRNDYGANLYYEGNGGDVRLAKETIDAIREVEKKAEEAEKKAKASAKEIVEKAKADAETLKKDGANSQLRRAEAEMADAKRRQDELFAQKDIETNQLVTELKEKASEKRAAAIDAVLAALG